MSLDDGTITCQGAIEFVQRLRDLPLDDKTPEIVTRYIFRGQGHASWKLVPSAFRPGTLLGYENQQFCRISGGAPKLTWDQGDAERVALFEFLTLADKVGLDIPIDHTWLSGNPFENVVGHDIGICDWPPPELYASLALAQHHGVPTRLLDFTYDPLTAAFFAAAAPASDAKHVAVWSIDLQSIYLATKQLGLPIEIVNVSRMHNRNLAAQNALFVLDRIVNPRDLPLEAKLEECVTAAVNRGLVPPHSRAVRKFCLPVGACDDLLGLLGKLGVDRAHMMPSFDGVVRELEARRGRQPPRAIPTVGEGL